MDYFNQNLEYLKEFFASVENEAAVDEIPVTEGQSTFIQKGNYYGGVYNGKKLMYSDILLRSFTPEKLQALIKNQL